MLNGGQIHGELCHRDKTRSSAQGNCSAKSLAGNVINSSLFINSALSSLLVFHQSCCMLSTGGSAVGGPPPAGGVWPGRGGSGRGRGQGTFQSSCHILHYHTVLLKIRGSGFLVEAVCEGPFFTTQFLLLQSHVLS